MTAGNPQNGFSNEAKRMSAKDLTWTTVRTDRPDELRRECMDELRRRAKRMADEWDANVKPTKPGGYRRVSP